MRRLLVAVAVLAGLLLLADYGSAAYAEYRVSRELRASLSLTADPDVRINGFPFLTQALQGRYRSVDVSASGVPVTGLGHVTVEATLHGVRVPPSRVISGNVTSVVADSVDARVRVGATDLGRYLGVPDLEVSEPAPVAGAPTTAPGTTVVLTGTVAVLGVKQKVSVDATLSLSADGAVAITATHVDLGAGGGTPSLAQSVASGLLARLSVTLDPSTVPFGIVPTAVRADGSEIVVEGSGTNITVVGGKVGS